MDGKLRCAPWLALLRLISVSRLKEGLGWGRPAGRVGYVVALFGTDQVPPLKKFMAKLAGMSY